MKQKQKISSFSSTFTAVADESSERDNITRYTNMQEGTHNARRTHDFILNTSRQASASREEREKIERRRGSPSFLHLFAGIISQLPAAGHFVYSACPESQLKSRTSMQSRVVTFATLAAALLAIAAAQERRAIALLTVPGQGLALSGNVSFVQTRPGEPVQVQGQISGLRPNRNFGFHIHEKGDISTKGCTSTGGHFNPQKRQHGAPTDKERHVGDLGNIRSDDGGVATISMLDPVLSLEGENNVLGRGVVLHEGEDDLGKGTGDDEKGSKATGNAGGRIACGVIGIQHPVEPWSSSATQVALSGVALTLLSAMMLL